MGWAYPGPVTGRHADEPALITSATVSKVLDADQRGKRYLASMAVRVACFAAGCFAPFPYNLGFFLGAAVIPGFAVILANAMDNHAAPSAPHPARDDAARALTSGDIVSGDVEDPRP